MVPVPPFQPAKLLQILDLEQLSLQLNRTGKYMEFTKLQARPLQEMIQGSGVEDLQQQ